MILYIKGGNFMLKKVVATICVVAMLATMLVGCAGKKNGETGTTQPDAATETPTSTDAETVATAVPEVDPHTIAGKVTIAVPKGELAQVTPVLEAFQTAYPNIELTIEPFEGSSGEWLTAQAANNSLPDVLWADWNNFPYAVANGYVRPLDDLLALDDETQYIPQSLLDPYVYGGKTYSVPDQIHAMMVAVNTDLLDELNLDKPSYDWTYDEFESLLKSATTDTTAGACELYSVDDVYSAQDAGFWSTAYNYTEQKFYYEDKWVPAMNKLSALRAVPGLELRALKLTNVVDENNNDYVKKFGEAGKDDGAYGFKNGFALMKTSASWEANWMRMEVKPNWEFWPYPKTDANSELKIPIHVNNTYMMSTCVDVDAAYQVLKWVSFGKEGNLVKMDIYANRDPKETVDGTAFFLWYFPVTRHPDVVAKFEQNPYVTEGLKVIYANIENNFRCDLNKLIPGYDLIFNEDVNTMLNSVKYDGTQEAAAVAAQVDEKVNAELANQLAIFNQKLTELK